MMSSAGPRVRSGTRYTFVAWTTVMISVGAIVTNTLLLELYLGTHMSTNEYVVLFQDLNKSSR